MSLVYLFTKRQNNDSGQLTSTLPGFRFSFSCGQRPRLPTISELAAQYVENSRTMQHALQGVCSRTVAKRHNIFNGYQRGFRVKSCRLLLLRLWLFARLFVFFAWYF